MLPGRTVELPAPTTTKSHVVVGPAAGISMFPVLPQEETRTAEAVRGVVSPVMLCVNLRIPRRRHITRLQFRQALAALNLGVMVGVLVLPLSI
jgi:hypothetical protein